MSKQRQIDVIRARAWVKVYDAFKQWCVSIMTKQLKVSNSAFRYNQ